MDTLSQTILGGAVGEVTLGHKLGNRAMVWGALLANIPDHDVLLRPFFGPVGDIAIHRTYSHSIVFILFLTAVFTPLARWFYQNYDIDWRQWSLYFLLLWSTHVLLDCFTTWGTQVFWPFSGYRVTFKSVFVIDPLYTVPFLLCIIAVPFLKRQNQWRKRLTWAGLALSSFYLLTTLVNKVSVNQIFLHSFQQQFQEPIVKYQTHPTPFNTILWSFTAETKKGYYIGHYSWFDEDRNIDFHYYPKQRHLLDTMRSHPKIKALIGITHGYYLIRKQGGEYILQNLRFGQTMGWNPKYRDFPFSYRIQPINNSPVIDYKITRHAPNIPNSGPILSKFWQRLKGV